MFRDRRQNDERRTTADRRLEDMPAADDRRVDTERRSSADRRRRTLLSAKIVYNDKKSILNCTVRNLSEHGARLIFGVTPMCPNTFELDLGGGRVHPCRIAYRVGPIMGVRFLDVDPEDGAKA